MVKMMSTIRQIVLLSLTTLLLAACAATPKFDASGIDLSVTPQQTVSEGTALLGSRQLWGGVIIANSNLKETTQLEILAYPLNSDQKPDTNKTPLGRFIALQQGYLETSSYSPGRLLTVSGALQESHIGHIGEAQYTYPTLLIEQLELWPNGDKPAETRFHFGVGVMLHN